jgi:DNA-binding CsgD family transcriptional regulator
MHQAASFKKDVLSSMFGLSSAKASTAMVIFEGCTPEQTAAQRGLSITTVRSHMQEVFQRTGAASQRDLIQIVGCFLLSVET